MVTLSLYRKILPAPTSLSSSWMDTCRREKIYATREFENASVVSMCLPMVANGAVAPLQLIQAPSPLARSRWLVELYAAFVFTKLTRWRGGLIEHACSSCLKFVISMVWNSSTLVALINATSVELFQTKIGRAHV